MSDAKGIPVALVLSGANRHDMKKLKSLLNAVIIARPSEADHEAGFVEGLCLDKGYDYVICRELRFFDNYEFLPELSAINPKNM